MARMGTSARGERVDFDILAIKQQLASKPVAIGVDSRRKFIDTKEGIKPKEIKQPVQNALKVIRKEDEELFSEEEVVVPAPVKSAETLSSSGGADDMLAFAKSAAKQSIKK